MSEPYYSQRARSDRVSLGVFSFNVVVGRTYDGVKRTGVTSASSTMSALTIRKLNIKVLAIGMTQLVFTRAT